MIQSLPIRLTFSTLRVPWRLVAVVAVALFSLAYFVYMTAPAYTWVNVASDAPDYMMGAQFLRISHATGEPLYLLLSAAWIRLLPIGPIYWRMALLSAIPMSGATTVLYLHTRKLLAPLVFCGAGLVVSQATIVELYGLTVFSMALAWHLHSRGHRAWAYVVLGLGCAVHHWAGLLFIGMAIRDIKLYGWGSLKISALAVLVGLPWYLYVPLANRPPYISIDGAAIHDYVSYWLAQGGLFGGIAVRGLGPLGISTDFWWRLRDIAVVIGGGLGIPALILFIVGARQSWRQGEKAALAIALLFAFHYLWNLDPHTYTYTLPFFAFGAIVIARAEPRAPWQILKPLAALTAVALIAFNLYAYDVQGPLLDSQQAGLTFYHDLATLPPGAALWSSGRDWEQMTAALWDAQEHGAIDLLSLDRPRPNQCELWATLQDKANHGLLYHAVLDDPATHVVHLAQTDARSTFLEMIRSGKGDVFKLGTCAVPIAQPITGGQ